MTIDKVGSAHIDIASSLTFVIGHKSIPNVRNDRFRQSNY